MNVVEVKFDYCKDTSFFHYEKLVLRKGLTIIVTTDRGLQFGKVIRVLDDDNAYDEKMNLYTVVRIATRKDYYHYLENKKMASEALIHCKKIVADSGIAMSIIDANYNFDRTQLLFRFVADERVDFRQLARNLGAFFHTRIELRQIGIRDKAKEIGGLGPCGRLLCCSSFLKEFDSITINMAKNQSVSLNPSKINGVCGRLLCCLRYENFYYQELKKVMPKIGQNIEYEGELGKVVAVNYLKKSYILEFDSKKRVVVDCESG